MAQIRDYVYNLLGEAILEEVAVSMVEVDYRVPSKPVIERVFGLLSWTTMTVAAFSFTKSSAQPNNNLLKMRVCFCSIFGT